MVAASKRPAIKRIALGVVAVSLWPAGVWLNAYASTDPSGSIVAGVEPDISSPLSLLDGAEFRKTIWENFQNVVTGCMEAKGFIYAPAPPPPDDTLGSVDPMQSTTDPADKTFGVTRTLSYKMATRSATAAGVAASSAKEYMLALRGVTITSTSDKYLATLDFRAYDGLSIQSIKYGSTAAETGGCEAEGRRLVSEPALNALVTAQEMAEPILYELTQSDPMKSAAAAWSTCMRNRGAGVFESPDQPEMYLQQKAAQLLESTTTTSDQWASLEVEEVELAADTDSCMRSSGVDSVIDEVTADEWVQFTLQNHELLMVAGGRTRAEGGAQ